MKLLSKLSTKIAAFDALPWTHKLAWRAGALISTLGVSLVIAWEATGFRAAEQESWRVYDRLEASGTPLSHDGFIARYTPPAELNCAEEALPILKRIEQRKLESEDDRFLITLRPGGFYEDELQKAGDLLQPFKQDLTALEAAIQKPHFFPQKDWRRGGAVLFAEYSQMRRTTKLWSTEAVLHAQQGRREEARRALRAGMKIASLASDQPVFIGFLVDVACRAIMASATVACIQVDPSNATYYVQALDGPPLVPLGRALRGETYFAISSVREMNFLQFVDTMRHYSMEEYETPPPPKRTTGLPLDPIMRAMVGRMLWYYERRLLTLGPDDREIEPGALTRKSLIFEKELEESSSGPNMVAAVIVPVMSQASMAETRSAAQVAIVLGLVTVMEFKRKNGHWPASLQEAGFTTPDPCSAQGEPLLYRVTPTDVRVYSRDRDGKDDGGWNGTERELKKLTSPDRDLLAQHYFEAKSIRKRIKPWK